MKTIITTPIYDYKGKFYRINPKKSGIETRILRPLLEQFEIMLSYHNKVFVWRLDIRLYEPSLNSEIITNFNRRFHRQIKRKYRVNRIGFMWARETEKAKQQHYHYVLMLDGNKILNPHYLQDMASNILDDLNASPHFVRRYHMAKRSDKESIDQATHHMSYLAKARGKGYREPQSKDYGGSRLKR